MEKTEVETVGKVILSCCLKNVRKGASKQTEALGVRLSPFLPAQIEFLFKAFPNKGEELSTPPQDDSARLLKPRFLFLST